jgi:thymidylate synthase (FAD)
MEHKAEKLERPHVKAIDEILGIPFPVLDDGFVRVIDYLGSDSSIVQAARVSYGAGTKKLRQDRGLIRYLLRHRHTTPFEMCEIKLHIRVPMDCWRQWIRHRTANINEYSTRYSIAINATQTTKPDGWRLQAVRNRQGSEGNLEASRGKTLSEQEKELQDLTRRIYNERLEKGVAREQARKDLLLSTYTEAYWKIDLHNLLHFLELRMESNAQYEIRCYANLISNEIVRRWCPVTWEAFQDYHVNAMELSALEQTVIAELAAGDQKKAIESATAFGWLSYDDGKLKENIERSEFEDKLQSLKISIPW